MANLTQTFGYSGAYRRFVVPAGRVQVHINAAGAGSGTRHGGRVAGTLPVNPGDVLYIAVGQEGRPPSGRQGGGPAFGGGGRGGDGTGSGDGGRGGGGATIVRLGSPSGTILVVAGGAGGTSGDAGLGGRGGASSGESGERGNSGTGTTGNATGGSQSGGGNGGWSGGGGSYGGGDAYSLGLNTSPNAPDSRQVPLSHAGGSGGQVNKANSNGGGGGGGGYFAGGGGQASATQDLPGGAATRRFPGGGGGGGSNYVSPRLRGASTARGTGSENNGEVVLTYSAAGYTLVPPTIPTNIFVNGVEESEEMATKSMGPITISADISDSNIGQKVRLEAVFEKGVFPGGTQTHVSPWYEMTANSVGQNANTVRATLTFANMPINTLYKVRLYARDEAGMISSQALAGGGYGLPAYAAVTFWTNRPPDSPTLLAPMENTQVPSGLDVDFEWDFTDPDGGDAQGAWELQWRTARTPVTAAGPWKSVGGNTGVQTYTASAAEFKSNTGYEWRVRTRDPEGVWGQFAVPRSFYVVGNSTPPLLTYPTGDQAFDAGIEQTFTWTFRDPEEGAVQQSADIRYRVVGTDSWITLVGLEEPQVPGSAGAWTLRAEELPAGYHYEWQARTTSDSDVTSEWSDSATFWTIRTPGSGLPVGTPAVSGEPTVLGYGSNRAYVYQRGGQVLVGELTGIRQLSWDRRRDDIGEISLVIDNFDESLEQLLRSLQTWAYEVVIFRSSPNGTERVAEGPITLIDDEYDTFTIEAKDVTAYLSRRVVRQGYSDAYQIIDGVQVGLRTVVERAERNIIDALAYDDPNVLPYLTAVKNTEDARTSRVVPDHSTMVLEDIDDMASNSGLDYVAIGRRIILWDTHRMIGRLPEMRNGDFLTPPKITEYGSQACNYYAVTDGSGVYGYATAGLDENGQPVLYGWLEMLASAYGTDPDEVVADSSLLTPEARAALEATFTQQAERNIAHRWPAPKQVKVPENARLNPELTIGINQLVPGAWVPVRAKSRILEVAQWQKIDRVAVTQVAGEESVMISMSPAPNGGLDPDAAGAEE